MGHKKDLRFAKLKVIEEASEVINEITDSMTKEDGDNYAKIISEIADLQVRLIYFIDLFSVKYPNAVDLLNERKLEKVKQIEKWKKENKYKNA